MNDAVNALLAAVPAVCSFYNFIFARLLAELFGCGGGGSLLESVLLSRTRVMGDARHALGSNLKDH